MIFLLQDTGAKCLASFRAKKKNRINNGFYMYVYKYIRFKNRKNWVHHEFKY